MDWHPQHSSLLAVGCYNGSVHVFDVRLKGSTPLYSSVPVCSLVSWVCPSVCSMQQSQSKPSAVRVQHVPCAL